MSKLSNASTFLPKVVRLSSNEYQDLMEEMQQAAQAIRQSYTRDATYRRAIDLETKRQEVTQTWIDCLI